MRIITSTEELRKLFKFYCEQYDKLDILVAWIGDPKNLIPFEYLKSINEIEATIGVDFLQTNPKGLTFLSDLKANVRIIESQNNLTFHPKIYHFKKGKKNSIIIGSSNLTYLGFGDNIEVNVLIEGDKSKYNIAELISLIKKYKSSPFSFPLTKSWLTEYNKKYLKRQRQIKRILKKDQSAVDSQYAKSNAWISKIEWSQYLKKTRSALAERRNNDRIKMLTLYKNTFSYPLQYNLFADKQIRKMLWGEHPYAAFGHVGASGRFKGLITHGDISEKRIIISSLNAILLMENIDYDLIEKQLNKLVRLAHGPTIKVWSRILTILKPDVFCTVSSEDVRSSLSLALNLKSNYFESVKGYIFLLKIIHESPWYNSKIPLNTSDKLIWKNRVALLDVLLY